MAEKVLPVRFQQATKTEAEWSESNPVLLKGEVAYSSDKKRCKHGDGTSTWSALSYDTASIADKLGTTTVGGATNPIYLNAGTATACSGRTVPGIKSASAVGTLGWGTNSNYVADISMLSYWNGAYFGTSSNLAYCNKGAFGSIITKNSGDYLPIGGGTLSGSLNFSNSGGHITWNSGTYHQRIQTTDDSNSDTSVFSFQQSSDSGSNWTDLMTIRDNGKVIANTFVGTLSGNASTASKLQTARTISLTGSVTGSGTFDGSGNLSIATTVNHTHSYLPLSGGTLTGNLSIQNESPVFTMKNTNSTEVSVVFDRNENANWKILVQGGILKFQNDWVNNAKGNYFDALTIAHQTGNAVFKGTVTAPTFNGSLSGNATSATKLTSSAGSATQPVYFSDGKPVVCTYTLGKSVPSDAVFTDKNVYQIVTTTEKYRPLVFGLTSSTDTSTLAASKTGQVYVTTSMYAQPSTGMIASTSHKIGEHVTLQYSSSTESLDFVFS